MATPQATRPRMYLNLTPPISMVMDITRATNSVLETPPINVSRQTTPMGKNTYMNSLQPGFFMKFMPQPTMRSASLSLFSLKACTAQARYIIIITLVNSNTCSWKPITDRARTAPLILTALIIGVLSLMASAASIRNDSRKHILEMKRSTPIFLMNA